MEKVLSNSVNNVDGISVVWQMECQADDMADGKAMYVDDTTQNLLQVW